MAGHQNDPNRKRKEKKRKQTNKVDTTMNISRRLVLLQRYMTTTHSCSSTPTLFREFLIFIRPFFSTQILFTGYLFLVQ